jgi:hypothetical protein
MAQGGTRTWIQSLKNITGNSEAHLGRVCARETETERETEGSEVGLSLHATCREKVTYPPNVS